jgi:hypothetical protein
MAEASAESISAPISPLQETPSRDATHLAVSASDNIPKAMESRTSSDILAVVTPWLSMFVWPLIVSLPLLLSSSWSPISYQDVFPAEWYDSTATGKPKPLGLLLGILTVVIGQAFVIQFFYLYKFGHLSSNPGEEPTHVQRSKAPTPYQFMDSVASHLFQPEGFVLLGVYLTVTWMFHLLPNSYYSFQGGIQWRETFLCLFLQDGFQYTMVSTIDACLQQSLNQSTHSAQKLTRKLFVCLYVCLLGKTASIRTCATTVFLQTQSQASSSIHQSNHV